MSHQLDNHTLSLIISGRMPELEWDSFSHSEWDLLIQKAQSEGVAPLLYWTLSKSGKILSFPEPVRSSLRAMYISVRMVNEKTVKELEILTHLFGQANIPVIALKGICFALTIYPDIGLRPMGDLDLLVPASKISEAVQIAKMIGYKEAVPDASPGLRELLNHEVCLRKNDAPYTILELHHSLVADKTFVYAVSVDWFWNQTESLVGRSSNTGFENLLMLTPTAQVLYTSAHAMLQHGGRNTYLRWVYDLDRLIRVHAGRMAWDSLLAQARTFEWSSAVSAALSQTVAYFDTPIPSDVLTDLYKVPDRNMGRVFELRSQPVSHTHEEYQKLKSLNWRGRFRLILALAAPSPVYMRWRYQLKTSWALPAYYLYRWLGIMKDVLVTSILLLLKVFMQVGASEKSIK